MAKGKQALASVRRRYEASIEHIDRLTSELVEAKARARRYQADAEAVPALRAKVAELQRQRDEVTSPALEAVRTRTQSQLEDAYDDLFTLGSLVMAVMSRTESGEDAVMLPEEWAWFVSLFGSDVSEMDEMFGSRTHRRNLAAWSGSADRALVFLDKVQAAHERYGEGFDRYARSLPKVRAS